MPNETSVYLMKLLDLFAFSAGFVDVVFCVRGKAAVTLISVVCTYSSALVILLCIHAFCMKVLWL